MTPDELPDDMEAVVSEWLVMSDEAEAFRSGLKSVVICQAEIDCLRALLKAYQEQRRALERLSALTPGAANATTARDLHLTVKAIADTALNQKGDEL